MEMNIIKVWVDDEFVSIQDDKGQVWQERIADYPRLRYATKAQREDFEYDNLMKEVLCYFSDKVRRLRDLGVKDIILDPGFGFGKNLEHNYELLNHMEEFSMFELPLLVGVSRKSMIYKLLGGGPEDALNGTTAINTISLMKGADILRVHDVRAAAEAVQIFATMRGLQKES